MPNQRKIAPADLGVKERTNSLQSCFKLDKAMQQSVPYRVELDHSAALRLAEKGAALLILGLPERSMFRIDQQVSFVAAVVAVLAWPNCSRVSGLRADIHGRTAF